jgi:hypothetical protein
MPTPTTARRPTLAAVAMLCLLAVLLGQAQPDGTPPSTQPDKRLTREQLDRSIDLARSYLLASQLKPGNFTYEYHIVDGTTALSDNQVRQAGAMWGLALLHQDNPTPETHDAVLRALAFFNTNSREMPDGRRFTVYPTDMVGQTNTVALTVLTIVDFLRAEPRVSERAELEKYLKGYIEFLLKLRKPDGTFSAYYDPEDGFPPMKGAGSSPYSDGEALLALVKAAKYAGYGKLQNSILASAQEMYRDHFEEEAKHVLKQGGSSPLVKGFYQWGAMAFYEIYTSDWKNRHRFGDMALRMSDWMLTHNKIAVPGGNNSYAIEGLAVSWEIARLSGDQAAMDRIAAVIHPALYELTTWQVGGPMPNEFLQKRPTNDPKAVGGVMSKKNDPMLRIDTTQHQAHALMLVRRFLYAEPKNQER